MNTVFYLPHPGIKARDPTTTASPTWLYWIDPSCDEASKGDFEACLFEARHWAKRAYERLTSETDTDFARVFHILFKVSITDDSRYPMSELWQSMNGRHPQAQWRTSAEHVLGVLHNFAHCWRRTYNRQEAEVRMYATDLAHTRWLPEGPDEAFDPVNILIVANTPAELHKPGTAVTACDGMWLQAEGENPRRVVMDFTPDLWTLPEDAPGHGDGVDEADGGGDRVHAPRLLTRWGLAQGLIPCVLFHEFMHVYLLDDFAESDDSPTGGWQYCMLQKRGEAPVCAESLAMLGLWAALADMRPADKPSGGFSLHRWWHEVPVPNLEDVLSVVRGELVFYADHTS